MNRERPRRQRERGGKVGGGTGRVAEAVHDGARRMRSRDRSVIRGKRMGGLSGAPIRFLSKATGYGQAVPLPGQYTWRQTKVDGSKPSGGQFGPSPGHFSATSQSPTDGRQATSADLKPSTGQVAPLPVQVSATSHGPAAARQTVPADWKLSAGQVALLPVQVSTASHGPADGRHAVVTDANPSAGHAVPVPVQVSATSQGPAEGRQIVVAGANPSSGQSRFVPVHVSATSQAPVEARHTVPAFPGGLSQNFAPPEPVIHMSTVQGLWSSQSASELQFGGVITQSDGSEFGCWDG